MFADHDDVIQGYLLNAHLVSADRLNTIRQRANADGSSLADAVIGAGVIERQPLLELLSNRLGFGFEVKLPHALPSEAVAQIPANLARRYRVAPLRVSDQGIDLAVAHPFGVDALDDLTFALPQNVRCVLADPDEVDALIERHYSESTFKQQSETPAKSAVSTEVSSTHDVSMEELAIMAKQAPVVRLVDGILAQAVREQASDLHLEPFEHEFRIRYRVDGVLRELSSPDQSLALPIISRIKVLANLNIAERRLPQDGRISFRQDNRTVDLRVSTLPTQFGESVVLRVLDQSNVQLDLEQLNLPDDVLAGVREVIARPNGIFLVTGPTGSGKTTTLYSGLRAINTADRKLLTAEDPVEYEIEGITQVPVNPATGLTFASALRSFLRQDPDALMVGEIRDRETAQIAIQASLTGHLVFSTLHTNDAPGTVTRLVDMGIEPYLIATALEGVLAQRLVRRICPHCRRVSPPTDEMLVELEVSRETVNEQPFFAGVGCQQCDGSGYKGRLGLFEWLRVNETIREAITADASTAEIKVHALAAGMRTLRDEGLRAIFAGETTAEEVIRCTQ